MRARQRPAPPDAGDCAARMTEFADWLRSDAPEGRGAFRPAAPEGAAANGAPEAGTAASDLELWRAEAYDGFPMHLARDIAGLASSIKRGRAGPEHRDPHEFLRDYLRYVLQPAYQSALAKAAGGRCHPTPPGRPPSSRRSTGSRRRWLATTARTPIRRTRAVRGPAPPAPRRAARGGAGGEGRRAGRGAGAVLEAMEALADAVDPPAHVPRSDQRRMDERLLDVPAAPGSLARRGASDARAQAVDEAIEEAKDGRPGMLLAAIVEARPPRTAPPRLPRPLTAPQAFDNPVSPVHRIVLTNEGGEEADAATRLEELRNKIPLVLQAAEGDEDSALRLMLFLAVHPAGSGCRRGRSGGGAGLVREASFWTNASGKAGEMETKESLEGAAVALGADEVGEDELLGGLEPSGEDQLGGGGLEGTPLTGSGMPLGLL
eukprot:tig00020830_g14485.t1